MRIKHFESYIAGEPLCEAPSYIVQLNQLLKERLGTWSGYPVMHIPSGQLRYVPGCDIQHYEWVWSENMRRHIKVGTEAVLVNGIYQLKPKYMTLRCTTAPRDCWVFAKSLDLGEECEWTFDMPYPGRVYLMEVWAGNKLMCSRQPNLDLTVGLINSVLEDRNDPLTLYELERLAKKRQEREKHEDMDKFRGEIDALVPIRNGMPGKRNHPTWQGIGFEFTEEKK